MCFPTALLPLKKCSANWRLTIATLLSSLRRPVDVKSRPSRIGIVHRLEVAGRQRVHERLHVFAVGRACDPRPTCELSHSSPLRIDTAAIAADLMPGADRRRSSSLRLKMPGALIVVAAETRATAGTSRGCRARRPVSVVFRFCRLRTNRPAPKSSRKLSATCAATSPLRRNSDPPGARDRSHRVLRASSRDPGGWRAARAAGRRRSPVTTVSDEREAEDAQIGIGA